MCGVRCGGGDTVEAGIAGRPTATATFPGTLRGLVIVSLYLEWASVSMVGYLGLIGLLLPK